MKRSEGDTHFYPFGEEFMEEGAFVKCTSAGCRSFVQTGVASLMEAINWEELCAKAMDTTHMNKRGTYQSHYGWATGVSYAAKKQQQVLDDYGCACPSELVGTRDPFVVDLFVIMSDIARAMGVDYADAEGMEREMAINANAYHPETPRTFTARMNRFARSLDKRNAFEGLTIAIMPLDGAHKVLEHKDHANCDILRKTLVASNILYSASLGCPVRVCLIGYMRKSIADFCLRRRAAEEVGTRLGTYWETLPASRLFGAKPAERFTGAGSDAVCVARDSAGTVVMAQLLSKAAMDKEITFLSPAVHAIHELSQQVQMTLSEGVQLCMLFGFVSNMLIIPTIIRTAMPELWPRRMATRGGVLGLLVGATKEAIGGVARGPHPRCQVSFTMQEISDHQIFQGTNFLVRFCLESQRGNHTGLDEKGLDKLFARYCSTVARGLKEAGFTGCGQLLVQHLVKVLVMCNFLHPLGILSCAITVTLSTKECPEGSLYVHKGSSSGSAYMSRLAVLQEMNVAYLRAAKNTDVTKSAVENMRCECLRDPEKMDPYAPGQPFIQLRRSRIRDTLVAHYPIVADDGSVSGVVTKDFPGVSLRGGDEGDGSPLTTPQGFTVPTGAEKQLKVTCAWRCLTIYPTDFENMEQWQKLRWCFLCGLDVDSSHRLIQEAPGFEESWAKASKREGGKQKRAREEPDSTVARKRTVTRSLSSRGKVPSPSDHTVAVVPTVSPDRTGWTGKIPPWPEGGTTLLEEDGKGPSDMTRRQAHARLSSGMSSSSSSVGTLGSLSIGGLEQWPEMAEEVRRTLLGVELSLPQANPRPDRVTSKPARGVPEEGRIEWKEINLRDPSINLQHASELAVRSYPEKDNWCHILHDKYRDLASTSDILRFPGASDTNMSGFSSLATKAVQSVGGAEKRLSIIHRFMDNGRWKRSCLDMGDFTYDFSTVGECCVRDQIAELIGGKKLPTSDSSSLSWAFATKNRADDFLYLCIIFSVGSAAFFKKEAQLARKRWSRQQKPAKKNKKQITQGIFVDLISNRERGVGMMVPR